MAKTTLEIRCDWGADGVAALAPYTDVFIVVDVLFATTAIDQAVSQGASVIPFLYRADTADVFAKGQRAFLARPKEAADPGTYSDLPSTLVGLAPGVRLAVPAADVAAIVRAASTTGEEVEPTVLAGCLRNAGAVADTARRMGRRISIICAGERWPRGGLRPAVEDMLGAGAIAHRLEGSQSPEAMAARAAFRAAWDNLPRSLAGSATGYSLCRSGYTEDVTEAAALNVSPYTPVFIDGAFRAAEW